MNHQIELIAIPKIIHAQLRIELAKFMVIRKQSMQSSSINGLHIIRQNIERTAAHLPPKIRPSVLPQHINKSTWAIITAESSAIILQDKFGAHLHTINHNRRDNRASWFKLLHP